MNIDGDLEDTPGIIEARTNYAKQETLVSFDAEKITPEQVISIIKKTGYTVIWKFKKCSTYQR